MKYKIVKKHVSKIYYAHHFAQLHLLVSHIYMKNIMGKNILAQAFLRGADYKTEILALANDIAKNLNEVAVGKLPRWYRV